jgi:hypothetical protein
VHSSAAELFESFLQDSGSRSFPVEPFFVLVCRLQVEDFAQGTRKPDDEKELSVVQQETARTCSLKI